MRLKNVNCIILSLAAFTSVPNLIFNIFLIILNEYEIKQFLFFSVRVEFDGFFIVGVVLFFFFISDEQGQL